MTQILLGGDSWACGEWARPEGAPGHVPVEIVHRGIEQYFIDDGFGVVNTAEGGSSNKSAVERLAAVVDDHYDYVIWIQTDPIRDLRPYDSFNQEFTSYNLLLEYSKQALANTYEKLNQFGVPVYCMGGCSKLDPAIDRYQNLVVMIPSLIEFLIPGRAAPEIWTSDWIRKFDRSTNIDMMDRLSKEKWNQDTLDRVELFQPDGAHPNRTALRLVYNFIRERYIK